MPHLVFQSADGELTVQEYDSGKLSFSIGLSKVVRVHWECPPEELAGMVEALLINLDHDTRQSVMDEAFGGSNAT